MKISLLHPAHNRVARADVAISEWLGKNSGLHAIEHIISIDDSDRHIVGYRRLAERGEPGPALALEWRGRRIPPNP